MTRPTRSKTELRSAEMNRRDRVFQKESAKEQQERANKTARLRALRIAKEADEHELAESLAVEKAAAKDEGPANKKAWMIKRRPATEESAATKPNADPAGF